MVLVSIFTVARQAKVELPQRPKKQPPEQRTDHSCVGLLLAEAKLLHRRGQLRVYRAHLDVRLHTIQGHPWVGWLVDTPNHAELIQT